MKNMFRTILAATMLAAVTADAASSSGGNYFVPADTIDAGGSKITGGTYSIDASIGGISGISIGGSQTINHGYVSQLSEISQSSFFRITATPPNVNESGIRQLSAGFVTNGMVTPVDPTQVVWSVVSGPVTSISVDGLASAGVVYQDTYATLRGEVPGASATFGLLVLNTNTDNFGSYAGDGIDDAWQVQYFGTNNPLAAPGADPDGDGQTNYFEYVATTNPTDGTSFLRLSMDATSETNRAVIRFSPYSPQRFYEVFANPSADSGSFDPINGVFAIQGNQATFTDTNATGTKKFYKVVISLPLQ